MGKQLSNASKVMGRTRISAVIVIIVLLFAGLNHNFAQPVNSPWPMHRYDAQGTAKSPHTGTTKAVIKWNRWTGYFLRPPVIATDGTIYACNQSDSLFAINPDGSTKWAISFFQSSSWQPHIPAIGNNGMLYTRGAWSDSLYALDQVDGHQIWRLYIGRANTSPIIGADGTVYITGNGTLYAINPDGGIKWRSDELEHFDLYNFSRGYMALSPNGNILYTFGDRKYLWVTPYFYAINTTTGDTLWRAGEMDIWHFAVGPEGTLYTIQRRYQQCPQVVALNPATGNKKWAVDIMAEAGAPAIDGNTVYVTAGDSTLYAITDKSNRGSIKWKFKMSGGHWGPNGLPPVIGADGTVYIVQLDGILFAIDPANGIPKWSLKGGRSMVTPPVIGADGTLYLGHNRGLYAVGPWLAGCWSCNNAVGNVARESSGHAVDGVLHGATWVDNSYCGSALSFDGEDDYVEIPFIPSIKPESEITVEFWFKMEEYSDSTLLSTNGYSYYFQGDSLIWALYIGSHYDVRIAKNDISLNKWHFLAGTYDGSALRIYLDGILKDEQAVEGEIGYTQANSLIMGAQCGWDTGATGNYFKGLIDELRIYSYGLTQSEILDEMDRCQPIRIKDRSNSLNSPKAFALYQNYPNPFNPVTTIKYDLPTASKVSIIIYNISGQKVETLVDKFKRAGYYSVQWDASDIGSGIYFYHIVADEYTSVKKCIVLK